MIHIDFSKEKGSVRPMHAVGQPPFRGVFRGLDFTPMQALQDAAIPYARLHDVAYPFGSFRYVDIPNIFRDFDADENDPASYDFTFTDVLLAGMHEYGIEPIYRLGVSIENQAPIKAYRIHPPKDFHKWARVCEHIVRHYNEGWANGFRYGITYWEIWNEPENVQDPSLNQMWTGTTQQFYDLYVTTALHLKKCFGDSIKIGGYASTGWPHIYDELEQYGLSLPRKEMTEEQKQKAAYRVDYFYGFLEAVKKSGAPLDFFSWHCYYDARVCAVHARFVRKVLDKYGFEKTESHLNEWNNAHQKPLVGSSFAAAQAAELMIAMQKAGLDVACYYDAGIAWSSYAGLFDYDSGLPNATYYSFKAFGELYRLGTEVESEAAGEGLSVLAAKDAPGEKRAVLIVNTGADTSVELPRGVKGFGAYLVEKGVFLKRIPVADSLILKENQVILLQNYEREEYDSH